MEDEKEASRWLKYWVFYGVISFFCACISHGTLVKGILCGLLLLKFNVSWCTVTLFIGFHYSQLLVR